MSTDVGPASPGLPAASTLVRFLAKQDVLVGLIGFVVVASLVSPSFFTAGNIGSLLSQSALLGILATAQFLVVVSGGFDLGVAAVMALASLIFASTIGLGAVACVVPRAPPSVPDTQPPAVRPIWMPSSRWGSHCARIVWSSRRRSVGQIMAKKVKGPSSGGKFSTLM